LGASLQASAGAVQMSLMAFFITLGLCQLFYGPLSDIVGRKLPILAGLAIFTVGSIGCAMAPNVDVLIAFRVLQAFGACGGMVVPRAVVRDMYTGHEAARLMSLLLLVVGISPILAPLAGSFIIEAWGWREVFVALAIASVIAFVLAVTQLPETRPAERRAGSSWLSSLRAYRLLLGDSSFIGLSLVGACGISAFFVFIGNAPFVYINHFGLSPTVFSLCFALNAASFFACSQFTAKLIARFGMDAVIRYSVSGFAAVMLLLGVLMTLTTGSLPLMMTLLFIGFGFVGLLLPSTAVLALEEHGEIAGTASALMGAIQMVTGAVAMGLTGLFVNDVAVSMAVGIALSAVVAFVIALFTLNRMRGVVEVSVG